MPLARRLAAAAASAAAPAAPPASLLRCLAALPLAAPQAHLLALPLLPIVTRFSLSHAAVPRSIYVARGRPGGPRQGQGHDHGAARGISTAAGAAGVSVEALGPIDVESPLPSQPRFPSEALADAGRDADAERAACAPGGGSVGGVCTARVPDFSREGTASHADYPHGGADLSPAAEFGAAALALSSAAQLDSEYLAGASGGTHGMGMGGVPRPKSPGGAVTLTRDERERDDEEVEAPRRGRRAEHIALDPFDVAERGEWREWRVHLSEPQMTQRGQLIVPPDARAEAAADALFDAAIEVAEAEAALRAAAQSPPQPGAGKLGAGARPRWAV